MALQPKRQCSACGQYYRNGRNIGRAVVFPDLTVSTGLCPKCERKSKATARRYGFRRAASQMQALNANLYPVPFGTKGQRRRRPPRNKGGKR